MPKDVIFSAFLSHSHADARWAKWLHSQIENFEIDRSLIGRSTSRGPVPKALRVFRLHEDLTAGRELESAALDALDRSSALIVLCSRASADSWYVNEEVRQFKLRHPDRPVLPVILDGNPPDCFPLALRYELSPDGKITDRPQDILAADLREYGDGKELALAKIVADLLALPLVEIRRRAEIQRRRRQRRQLLVLVGFLLIVSALGIWAEMNRREAVLARTEADAMRQRMATLANIQQRLPPIEAQSLRRFALLIANSKYVSLGELPNPLTDAAAVATALRDLDFDVTVRTDLGREALRAEIRTFEARLHRENPDWALVYFSGHGSETTEGAFMLPTDILLPKADERVSDINIIEDAVSIGNVLRRLQAAKALRLVIYDACRDNPALSAFNRVLAQARSATPGANRTTGMTWGKDAVFFATSPGTFALDGTPGELSPFARSLVSVLEIEGLEMKEAFRRVADTVEAETRKLLVVPQRPELRGAQLDTEHYFRPTRAK